MSPIGRHDPAFTPVAEAFGGILGREDTGAAVCVFHRGRAVVDLVGGHLRPDHTSPWQPDTLVMTYSTTKPLAAVSVVLLADRGALELDEPVVRYWPTFAGGGKESLTVRGLLTHQAGLLVLDAPATTDDLLDHPRLIALLEDQTPMWPPGTRHGEHAAFYGHLLSELVRRVDGRTLGRFFAEEIGAPWGLDFHIGVPEGDLPRVSPLHFADGWLEEVKGEAGSLMSRALNEPPGMLEPDLVNSERWLRAEIPAVNGVGTARAIARFYEGIRAGGELDGTRVLSPEAARSIGTVHSSGPDALLGRHVNWGLGVQIDEDGYGHGGLGGSLGWCSEELEVSFGYVTNTMSGAPRADTLWEAVLECLR